MCTNDCGYCGIRKHMPSVKRYTIPIPEVVEVAKWAFENRMGTLMLQSGGEQQPLLWTQPVSPASVLLRDCMSSRTPTALQQSILLVLQCAPRHPSGQEVIAFGSTLGLHTFWVLRCLTVVVMLSWAPAFFLLILVWAWLLLVLFACGGPLSRRVAHTTAPGIPEGAGEVLPAGDRRTGHGAAGSGPKGEAPEWLALQQVGLVRVLLGR